MDPRLTTAVIVVVGVPAVLVGYILATEQVLRVFPQRAQPRIRPWLWLLPALAFLFVFLIYPTIGTFVRSLQNEAGTQFIGLANYAWFFGNNGTLAALKNSLIWVVLLTVLAVGLGLLIAILFDRVRYESFAKTVIFLPLAISATAASVIWLFMFAYQPPGTPQTGTLNAAVTSVGVAPQPWLTLSGLSLNTILLVLVTTWIWTGLLHGDHLGRAQGDQRRAARGGPGRRRHRVAGLQGDHLPAPPADPGGGLDHDHHHRPEGVRHRVRHDQRELSTPR